jgi:hypothetical protein
MRDVTIKQFRYISKHFFTVYFMNRTDEGRVI